MYDIHISLLSESFFFAFYYLFLQPKKPINEVASCISFTEEKFFCFWHVLSTYCSMVNSDVTFDFLCSLYFFFYLFLSFHLTFIYFLPLFVQVILHGLDSLNLSIVNHLLKGLILRYAADCLGFPTERKEFVKIVAAYERTIIL